MLQRTIFPKIITQCFQSKAIIIYGPRQVGKTTLLKQIATYFETNRILSVTGDDNDIQEFYTPALRTLRLLVEGYDIIMIDEAQRIRNIGLVLKLLVDHFPDKQFIATGSSSFDLANAINEPLTGRAYIHYLYPLSLEETETQKIIPQSLLQQRLLYGSYPELIENHNIQDKDYLNDLVNHYLYKDILSLEGIKNPTLIKKITQALALQIGSEFSYSEIAITVGADKKTVEKYINILEQAYIITLLHPLHTNQRREIKMNKKVYFRDLGVRNAVLGNFLPLDKRQDVGALRENFFFIERTKYTQYHNLGVRQHFWRWVDAGEIDLVESKDDHYTCFECKRSNKKGASTPSLFAQHYPNHDYNIINPNTMAEFVFPNF